MQLKLLLDDSKHQAPVSCIGWSPFSGELYTIGEDHKFLKWSRESEFLGTVSNALFSNTGAAESDVGQPGVTASSKDPALSNARSQFYTCMDWFPGKSEMFALGNCDGKIIFCGKLARAENILDAHRGSVLCLAWNMDGSALLSGGEDGLIKIWSKVGMLRSVLVTQVFPLYAAAWSADSSQILYTSGRLLAIKSLQPGGKTLNWKAHDGCILKLSWSSTTSLIVSGGEDKKYKVWDHYGRLLYSSQMMDHAISCLAWSPMGDCFAVGCFNSLRICDRLGWTQAITATPSGSIYSMAWTSDGTTLACASARGCIMFCHAVQRRIEWRNLEVTLMEEKLVYVKDILSGVDEKYDFKENIMKIGVGYHAVLLVSATQCHVLCLGKSLNSFDLPVQHGRISILKQCKAVFALVDSSVGISIYSYSGKLISVVKLMRPEMLSECALALSDDILAIKDPMSDGAVLIYDTQTGKKLQQLKHPHGIRELALDQIGFLRHLALIDKNMDVWISQVGKSDTLVKLGGMTESICFAEDSPILVAIMDGQVCFWMCPAVVFLDPDIKALTRKIKDPIKHGQILWCVGAECYVRRADGTNVVVGWTCPYTRMLHEYAQRKKWDLCLKICRAAKSKELWAVLACLSLNGNDLNTAEVAYAAIGEAHKVQSICNIRELKSNELRNAELMVFKKQFKEAEALLLSSGQIYFAIRMWVELYQWDRALELALRYKDYLSMVVAYRSDYVAKMCIPELNKKYLSQSQNVIIDRDAIKAQILAEERKIGLAS